MVRTKKTKYAKWVSTMAKLEYKLAKEEEERKNKKANKNGSN